VIGIIGCKPSGLKALLGIRARLVILALILVVPLMMDRVWLLEASRAKQLKQIANELSELAKHTANAQREIISTVQAVLKSSAYIYATAAHEGRGCAILRASLRVDLPWIRSLSIVGPEGTIQCSTLPHIVGFQVGDRDYIRTALTQHEFVVSDYILSRATGLPTIIAAYPVSALDGGPQPVVVAAIDLTWMSDLLGSRGGRAGVSVFLVDGQGTILATRPDKTHLIGQQLKDTSLLEAVTLREINLAREAGSIAFTSADGEREAVSFARVAGTRARMIVTMNQAGMLGDVDRDIRNAYLELALVVVLALLGAWYAGERLIVRPIRIITEMANRFGQGDLAARATSTTLQREFVPLARAFNAMAAQLAARQREMVAANDRLTVIASLDVVSGLANRRGFQSRLDFEWMRALQTGNSLSLLMIDVDHFKAFNDSYGHPEGDVCLSRVGAALTAIADHHAGFAARYGGEEFCLLLAGTDAAEALRIGEIVRATVEHLAIPHVTNAARMVTVSIGVATVAPVEFQRQDDLVEAADTALYAAKRRGRNTVVEHAPIIRTAGAVPAAG
jgi:diguanylate cyclase (GGDEF)-like protein